VIVYDDGKVEEMPGGIRGTILNYLFPLERDGADPGNT